jgi:hypothetical protein
MSNFSDALNCTEAIVKIARSNYLYEKRLKMIEFMLTRKEAFLFDDFQVLLDEFIRLGDERLLEIFNKAVQSRLR